MLKAGLGKIRYVSHWIYKVLSSRSFFIAVVLLALLQGVWFAFTFRPVLFDELRHLQFIELYSHMVSPFITHQTAGMDALGQVAREPSYLYYYVMAGFLRFFQLFTGDSTVQILLLRLINIGLFVASLFLFRKFFRELKVSAAVTHSILLGFILIPAVGAMIGAVTYDTGVLPLVILMLIYTARILRSKRLNVGYVLLLIILVCIASVVKYTSLPIAAVCIVAVLSHYGSVYRGKLKKLWEGLCDWCLHLSPSRRIILAVVLILSLALFVERPLQNVVMYGGLSPSCFDTLDGDNVVDRCTDNYVYQRDAAFLAAKPHGFIPVDQMKYLLTTWIPGMHASMVQQYPSAPPLIVMVWFYYIAMLGGAIVIVMALRDFLTGRVQWFVFAATLVYMLSVFYTNYKGYEHLGQPVAITARYLIPILPLCIYLLIDALRRVAGKKIRIYLPILAALCLIVSTQGGGIITHLISANQTDYWQNNVVMSVNNNVKAILDKLTKN